MDANLPRKPLELEPLDEPTSGGDSASAGVGVQRGLGITTADEFLAQAASEYQEGHIDQALWRRTSAQTGDDEALAVAAYLRARATALRLQKREERADKRASRAGSMRGASDPKVELQSPRKTVSTTATGYFSGKPKLMYAGAAVALAIAVAVVWLAVSPRNSELVPQPIVTAAKASGSPSVPPTSLARERPVAQNTSVPANQTDPGVTLEAKVQELKKAGNWNVLVLYASEWTRKEPDNAAAWNELSMGYVQMRQLGDAHDAATKAVQLAPEDSRHWRNLGHVNLALDSLSEARIAFDKASALSPEDADALCGAALVARREGRAKEAEVIAVRLKSTDGSCADASVAVSPPVVAGGAAARKTVPPRSR